MSHNENEVMGDNEIVLISDSENSSDEELDYSENSMQDDFKSNIQNSVQIQNVSVQEANFIKKINDVEESETFDYLYNFHNDDLRSNTNINLSNINIIKLFRLIEKNPNFSLPIFLWIDTFHDFKKDPRRLKNDKDTSKNEIKESFLIKFRNSFFININEGINKCYNNKNIDFTNDVQYTVLKPLYEDKEKRKEYACLLYNISEMIINKSFEKDLLCCYINYFFFGKEPITVKNTDVSSTYSYYNIRNYVNNLHNILNNVIVFDTNSGYIRDVEDRHMSNFIIGKLITVPASLFDKNPKNSTKLPSNIINISKSSIPFVNGYGNIIYEYNSSGYNIDCNNYQNPEDFKNCYLKVGIPIPSQYKNNVLYYDSTCKDPKYFSPGERKKYNMGFSVNEVFDIIYQKYLSPEPEETVYSCKDLDWWVSLKRVGDYGQIIQAKQLGIPLSTSDNMQLLLSLVSCSSIVWKPKDKLLFYDGFNDCFRDYKEKNISKWLIRKNSDSYKNIINKILLTNDNFIKDKEILLKNSCSTFETDVNLSKESEDNIPMILPTINDENIVWNEHGNNFFTKYGNFISNYSSKDVEFNDWKVDPKYVETIYGYSEIKTGNKIKYKYLVKVKDVDEKGNRKIEKWFCNEKISYLIEDIKPSNEDLNKMTFKKGTLNKILSEILSDSKYKIENNIIFDNNNKVGIIENITSYIIPADKPFDYNNSYIKFDTYEEDKGFMHDFRLKIIEKSKDIDECIKEMTLEEKQKAASEKAKLTRTTKKYKQEENIQFTEKKEQILSKNDGLLYKDILYIAYYDTKNDISLIEKFNASKKGTFQTEILGKDTKSAAYVDNTIKYSGGIIDKSNFNEIEKYVESLSNENESKVNFIRQIIKKELKSRRDKIFDNENVNKLKEYGYNFTGPLKELLNIESVSKKLRFETQKISNRKKGYRTLSKGYKKSRGRKIKRYPSSKN